MLLPIASSHVVSSTYGHFVLIVYSMQTSSRAPQGYMYVQTLTCAHGIMQGGGGGVVLPCMQ